MLYSWLAEAQPFSFNIETAGFANNETVILSKYHGKDEVPIDSVKGSGTFTIRFSSPFGVDGLYLLTASRSEIAEFIINSTEKGLLVKIDKTTLKSGAITILNSQENIAYSKFVSLYLSYEQEFFGRADQTVERYDPKILSKLQEQTTQMEATQRTFNLALDELIEEFPNTFTTKILCPLAKHPIRTTQQQLVYETYSSFMTNNFWALADFSNSLVLNHFLLNEHIKNFFRFFVVKNETHMKLAVDKILSKAKANKDVDTYIRSFLLRNFLRSNANALSTYVSQISNDGLCELTLTEEEMEKLSTLSTPLDTGDTAPITNLPDKDQKMISLSEVYQASPLTIVFFWSAKCVHCLNEIPVLVDLYEQYNSSGLAVYAINLDENKFDWRDYLDENNMPWVNVTDMGPLKQSQLIKDYSVYKTPSSFVLDTTGKVLVKNISVQDLESFVKKYLTPK